MSLFCPFLRLHVRLLGFHCLIKPENNSFINIIVIPIIVIPWADLFQAGLNVGREVPGSMANTLVFAYFGNSLFLALLITEAEPVPKALLDNPAVADEIFWGLTGTAVLLLTIPLTALFGVAFRSQSVTKTIPEA